MANCITWFEVRSATDDVCTAVEPISFVDEKEAIGNVLEPVLVGVSDGWVKATMNVLDFFERSETVLELALGQENPSGVIGKTVSLFQDML